MTGAMRACRGLTLSALLLVACSSSEPSKLDSVVKGNAPPAANDPWSASRSDGDDRDGDGDDSESGGGLGGMDLKGMLEKLGEGLEKPGPYEAPAKSAELDDTKPHWGVMSMSGGIAPMKRASLSIVFSWSLPSGSTSSLVHAPPTCASRNASNEVT